MDAVVVERARCTDRSKESASPGGHLSWHGEGRGHRRGGLWLRPDLCSNRWLHVLRGACGTNAGWRRNGRADEGHGTQPHIPLSGCSVKDQRRTRPPDPDLSRGDDRIWICAEWDVDLSQLALRDAATNGGRPA